MKNLTNFFKNIFPIFRISLVQILGILKVTCLIGFILNIKLNEKYNNNKKIQFIKIKNNKNYLHKNMLFFNNFKIDLKDNWIGKRDLFTNFNIHYFDYIHELNNESMIDIIKNWSENLEYHYDISMHPYVISRRLINFCIYYINNTDSDLIILEKVIKTDFRKIIFNLEFRLRNNHLSSNFTSIYLVINIFSNSIIKNIFNKFYHFHITSQILSDGCHIEQTPMYHHLFLQDLILINEFNFNNNIFSKVLINSMLCMNQFNKKINPSSTECSYFNDSNNFQYISSSSINNFIRIRFNYSYILDYSSFVQKKSGFYFFNYLNINYIFFDSSVINKFNPGHIHSGLLSYEIYKNGIKIITNLGVYDYNINNRRLFLRSDLSKNTSYLKELSFGIYKSFRIYHFPKITKCHNVENNFNFIININYSVGIFKKIKFKRTVIIKKNIIQIFDTSNVRLFNSYVNSSKYVTLHKYKKCKSLFYMFLKFPDFYLKEKVFRYKLKTQNHRLFYKIDI